MSLARRGFRIEEESPWEKVLKLSKKSGNYETLELFSMRLVQAGSPRGRAKPGLPPPPGFEIITFETITVM